MESIEEIIKESTPIEKVQTLISMIDTSHGGRRKYPKGIILLAQSLKEDYPPHPPNKNKYKYSNNPQYTYTYIISIKEYI